MQNLTPITVEPIKGRNFVDREWLDDTLEPYNLTKVERLNLIKELRELNVLDNLSCLWENKRGFKKKRSGWIISVKNANVLRETKLGEEGEN